MAISQLYLIALHTIFNASKMDSVPRQYTLPGWDTRKMYFPFPLLGDVINLHTSQWRHLNHCYHDSGVTNVIVDACMVQCMVKRCVNL